MTYGHIAAALTALGLAAATVVAIVELPDQHGSTYVAVVGFAVPAVLFAAGLVGLVWDRWLTR